MPASRLTVSFFVAILVACCMPRAAQGQVVDWIGLGKSFTNSTLALDAETHHVQIDNDGNVYAAGTYHDSILFDTQSVARPSHPGARQDFLIKYSPDGEVLWTKTTGGASWRNIAGLHYGVDGFLYTSIIVSGFQDSNAHTFTFDSIDTTLTAKSSQIIAKLDPNDGSVIWYRHFLTRETILDRNIAALYQKDTVVTIMTRYSGWIALAPGDTLRSTVTPTSTKVVSTCFIRLNTANGNTMYKRTAQQNSNSYYLAWSLHTDNAPAGGLWTLSQYLYSWFMLNHRSGPLGGFLVEPTSNSYSQHNMVVFGRLGANLGFGSIHKLEISDNQYFTQTSIHAGNMTVIGERIYATAFINSAYNVPRSFRYDGLTYNLDTLSTAGNILFLVLDWESFELLDYKLVTGDYLDNSIANPTVTAYGDRAFLGFTYLKHFKVDSISYVTQDDPDLKKPVILRYDTTDQSFSWMNEFNDSNYDISLNELDANDSGYVVAGGGFYSAASLMNQSVGNSFRKYTYAAKFKDCNMDENQVVNLSGTHLLCTQNAIDLETTASSNEYTLQWLRNGIALANETDEDIEVSVPGAYQMVIYDGICTDTSNPVMISTESYIDANLSLEFQDTCNNVLPFTLTGGSPAGGTYFGQSITNGVFDPSTVGSSNTTIYYTITDTNGCHDTTSVNVGIDQGPTVFYYPAISTVCNTDTVALTGGLPVGGIYSGTGVVGDTFYGVLSDTGTHYFTYTFSNTDGCTASDSISVNINHTPSASLNLPLDSTCENASPIVLSGHSPPGGTFTGQGIVGGYIVPQVLSPGGYAITYSLTQNGCTGVARDSVHIDSFPDIVLPNLDSICLSAIAYPLTHGYPSGGTYSGTGISNNVFDASVAGMGTHTVMYVFENTCAADTGYATITVIGSPSVSATVTHANCHASADGSLVASVIGGNGPYTFAWQSGDQNAQRTGLTAGLYTVTATGDGGCTVSNSFTVGAPADLVLNADSLDPVVCNGFSDGEATISTSGGVPGYSYLWSNGATTEDLDSLTSGTYVLTVTDANGCLDSLEILIDQLNPVAISDTTTHVTCYEHSDGSILTNASGGGGTFSFAWSTGATSSTLTSLTAGDYTLTVTDQNGCSDMDTVSVLEPDSISIFIAETSISCHGFSDGSLSASALGGNGGYTFLWSNTSTNDSIDNLSAAMYSVTVTDGAGCTKTESLTLDQPDSLAVQFVTLEGIPCHGDLSGEVAANVTGGIAPITYSWNTGAVSDTLTQLAAGTYTISVADANNCLKIQTYVLTQPDVLSIDIDSIDPLICFDDSSGFLGTLVSGGTSGFHYVWSNGDTTQNLNGLSDGIYEVSVSDANGCTATDLTVLFAPSEMLVSLSSIDNDCFGGNVGSIGSVVYNNQGALTYAWSNGSTDASPDSLIAGSYTLTLTDSAGCVVHDSAYVSEESMIVINASIFTNPCTGDTNGSLSTNVYGGVPGYTYLWATGDTTDSISELTAGTYTITVTDSIGCAVDSTIQLTDPDPIQFGVPILNHLSCYQDSSGLIAGTIPSGGTQPFSLLWSDGAYWSYRSSMAAGTYSLTVTDQNGCVADTSYTLTEPPEIVVSIDAVLHNACFGDSLGGVAASANGGLGALSYEWNLGQTTSTILNLPAGTYTVTVTDTTGCIAVRSDSVGQPDSLFVIFSDSNTSCDNVSDGSVTATGVGGIPVYSYQWNTLGTLPAHQGLTHGTYYLTVTDANGCEIQDSVYIGFDHNAPEVELSSDTTVCMGDSVTLTATASTVVQYHWSTLDTTNTIVTNQPGTYSVEVTDTNGCQGQDSADFATYPLPVFDLGNDSILCKDSMWAGLPLYGPNHMETYFWSTGEQSQSNSVAQFGTYTLTVTDSNGCASSDTITFDADTCLGIASVSQSALIRLYPNPNFGQFTIEPAAPGKRVQVRIYSVRGALVQETSLARSRTIDIGMHGSGLYLIRITDGQTDQHFQVMVL